MIGLEFFRWCFGRDGGLDGGDGCGIELGVDKGIVLDFFSLCFGRVIGFRNVVGC